jgi:uncharacterized protein DUF2703
MADEGMGKEDLLARIQGTVTDSRSATPWAGVEVFVRGRNYRAQTDDAGRYDLPYYWESREITVMFVAPSRLVKRPLIASKVIAIDRGDIVRLNVDVDASQFADPPLEIIKGEFHGHFRWGFEDSSFTPDGGSIRTPDGSLRSISSTWVELRGRARTHPFKPLKRYRVKWVGRLTGPGCYGHLGASDYLLEVREILESQEEVVSMKRLPILWQRLMSSEGKTSDRCDATYREMQRAIEKLKQWFQPFGIEPSLEIKEIDERTFNAKPSESNRIWIAGRPMEEWLGASVGSSPCCEKLIRKAALLACAQLG